MLLTGASGFIGAACIPHLLAAGYDVHCLSRQAKLSEPQVTWHLADILAAGSAERVISAVRPSHLLHMAWYAVPGLYWTALENYGWVGASMDLLRVFAACGGVRAVMAGTCAEYDWRYGWCSEAVTPLNPATPYGVCKNSLQTMVTAFSSEARLTTAWGRIFFLYGPGEHPSRLVSSVITALLRQETAACSSGEQVRDFLHVSDVAHAFVSLLDSPVQGAVNIASGQPTAVREVVSAIGRKLDREDLLRFGARPTPPGDPPLLVADVRRLNDELGWRPKYSLDAGLDAAVEWWRQNLLPR